MAKIKTISDFEHEICRRVPMCKPRHLFYSYVARRHPFIAIRLAVPKFFKSLKGWNRNHLGSCAIYEGKRYWIANMAGAYRLRLKDGDHDPKNDLFVSLEDEGVKPEMTFGNCRRNALYMYEFWCESWASIDIQKVFEPDKYKGSDGILGENWFEKWV